MSHVISWAGLDLGLSGSSDLASQAGTLFWSCILVIAERDEQTVEQDV